MNLLINLVIELLAGAVNVAAIRWPKSSMPGVLPESEFERRRKKRIATSFVIALIVGPLVVMAWLLS